MKDLNSSPSAPEVVYGVVGIARVLGHILDEIGHFFSQYKKLQGIKKTKF